MSKRLLVAVDIDGVLNPYAAKATRRPEGFITLRLRPKGWEHAKHPLRVWLDPTHGALLLNFAAAHDAELVWATTWEHDANTMIGPQIGLPELPVIEFGNHPGTIKGWKYPAVAKYAAGRPLVWLDDDFRNTRLALQSSIWSEARVAYPTLLHHVSPAIGITQLDLSAVSRWLEENNVGD